MFGDRLKKEQADYGPLTLIYADGPMFLDPYRPGKIATLHREGYPTNAAALARVQQIWGRGGFDGPFIIDSDNAPLWNTVELARVVDGTDKGAPTLVDSIRKYRTMFVLTRKLTLAKVREGRQPRSIARPNARSNELQISWTNS